MFRSVESYPFKTKYGDYKLFSAITMPNTYKVGYLLVYHFIIVDQYGWYSQDNKFGLMGIDIQW